MSATQVIVNLLGDVALLLWGIHMVQTGILRAYGAEFRRFMTRSLRTRPRAFAAGLAVTTALQSSTATALIATSFAADGLVALAPALALMLGANVGSTLIVQIFSFDMSLVYPALVFTGVVLFKRGMRARLRDLGRVGIGLGLMLLALHLLIETMKPVEGAAAVMQLLGAITRDPVINLILAAALTWAAYSSVAVMLFIISLSGAAMITPAAALAMVLGANLGSAVNPVLQALGDPVRMRLPACNLAVRLAGCLAALPLLPYAARWLGALEPEGARVAANFHVAFNLALAAVFMPLLPALSRLAVRLLPNRAQTADPGRPRYLDASALDTPSIALANAAREALRVADVIEAMLRGSRDQLRSNDRRLAGEIAKMDDIADRLHREIEVYLTSMSREAASEAETRRLVEIRDFTINLEHVGDIIEKNLMELAGKRVKQQIALSADVLAEIDDLYARLLDHLQLAVVVFMSGDVAAARRLVQEKEAFREFERAAAERHFERLRGAQAGADVSGLEIDIIRDLKRIDSHIAATAYPLLQQSDMLRGSRLV